MAQEQMKMPSGIGGLVRYFDDYKSKIEIKAIYFVAFVILVILFYVYITFK